MTERIKQGMKVEVSDILHPYKLWVATVSNNKFYVIYVILYKYDILLYI